MARRYASAAAAARPASASRCARVVQAGWNRSTAGSSIASSARSPASGPSISPSTAARPPPRPATAPPATGRGAACAARSRRRCPAKPCCSAPTGSPPRTGSGRAADSRGRGAAAPHRGRSARVPARRRPARRAGRSAPSAVRRAGLRASERHTSAASPSTSGSSGSSSASTSARCSASADSDSIGAPCGVELPIDRIGAVDRLQHRGQPLRRGRRGRAARTGCPRRGCASWPAPVAAPWSRVRPRRPRRSAAGVDAEHRLQHQRRADVRRDGGMGADQHQLEPPVGNRGHVIFECRWSVVDFVQRLGHPVGG